MELTRYFRQVSPAAGGPTGGGGRQLLADEQAAGQLGETISATARKLQDELDVAGLNQARLQMEQGLNNLHKKYENDTDYNTVVERYNTDLEGTRASIINQPNVSKRGQKYIETIFDSERTKGLFTVEGLATKGRRDAARANYTTAQAAILEAVSSGRLTAEEALAKYEGLVSDNTATGFVSKEEGAADTVRAKEKVAKASYQQVYNYHWKQALAMTTQDGIKYLRTAPGLEPEDAKKLALSLKFFRDEERAQRLDEYDKKAGTTEKQWLAALSKGELTEAAILEADFGEPAELSDTVVDLKQKWIDKVRAATKDKLEGGSIFNQSDPVIRADVMTTIMEATETITHGEISAYVGKGPKGGLSIADAEHYHALLDQKKTANDILNRPDIKEKLTVLKDLYENGRPIRGKLPKELDSESQIRYASIYANKTGEFQNWLKANPQAKDIEIEAKFQRVIEPLVAEARWYWWDKDIEDALKEQQEIILLPDPVKAEWQEARRKGVKPANFLEEWRGKKKKLDSTKEADREIARHYYILADGDKKKAEQMLKNDGYAEDEIINKTQLKIQNGKDMGSQILEEYPGLKNSPEFKNGFQVISASPDRIKEANKKFPGRTSEYYEKGWGGGGDMLDNPGDTSKAVMEVYSEKYMNDPSELKKLVLGEAIHGMKQDPQWESMRDRFYRNFSDETIIKLMKFFKEENNNWSQRDENETFEQMMQRSGTDAFIRAYFMDDHGGKRLNMLNELTEKQKRILEEMKTYLKTKNKNKN